MQKEESNVIIVEEILKSLSIEQISSLMANVAEYSKFSFKLEGEREQSVAKQTGQMLTAASVTSAAVLMSVPILLERTCFPQKTILFSAGTVLVCIFISMAFAVYSQWRFKYKTMMNGKELLAEVAKNIEKHEHQYQYNYQWIVQLTEIQDSKKKNNDIRCDWIRRSMFFFGIAIVVMFLIACSLAFSCLL